MTALPRHTVALLVAALFAAPCVLGASEAALGNDGAVYRVTAGRYGDLFPGGHAADRDAAVLSLEVAAPGEPRLRRLVPGSEGPAVDRSPVLVFEARSGTAYLIWESRRGPRSSAILLVGLRGEEWTGPVELSGDVAPLKGAPTVLVTRDDFYRPTVTEGRVLQVRTVLHIVWCEGAADAEAAVQYTPVVMEDGAYVGWNPVFRLDALDPNEPAAEPLRGSELVRSPTLAPGTDVNTVIVAFGHAETSRLLTVQARVLPGELGLLADRIPAAVAETGYTQGEDRLEAIRGILRSHIIEIGNRFNPGVVEHFADSAVAAAQALHEAEPDLPIEALGDDLRSHIIEIGATVLGDVSRPARAKASRVLEVGGAEGGGPEPEPAATVSNLVHLRLVRDLPAPEGGEGPARIYASEDGTRLLVSWNDEAGIVYTESVAEASLAAEEGAEAAAWTPPLVLDLGEEPDAREVESVLRARVSQRP